MGMDGFRFTVERRKLCLWLEGEKKKISRLPDSERAPRELEVEREFRSRMDRLYGEVRPDAKRMKQLKLN